MSRICFMLLGNPPANSTDVEKHWTSFISTITDNTCVFINHPQFAHKKDELEKYVSNYNYLNTWINKIGISNTYICNSDDLTHIKTMWASVTIVYAELMLIQESIMRFGLCDKYILISSTCCPLYSYPTIYSAIMQDNLSWISIMTTKPYIDSLDINNFYNFTSDTLSKSSNIFNYYMGLKISQWLLLDKSHVKYLFSVQTLEQKARTYLYDKDIECKKQRNLPPNLIGKIKFNPEIPDTPCTKDNCLPEIIEFIKLIDKVLLKNNMCNIIPLDEFAIQQFILNKILNNYSKDKYLTNKENLISILKLHYKIIDFKYISDTIESNYLSLNEKIKFIPLDYYYNEPRKNELYPNEELNFIDLRKNPTLKSIIKSNVKLNTKNLVYLGKKVKTYPCKKVYMSQHVNSTDCESLNLSDIIFIGCTYTNWMLITNNLSNYLRSVKFKTEYTRLELEQNTLKQLFDYENDKEQSNLCVQYIKVNFPSFYETKFPSYLKPQFSLVELPVDIDSIISEEIINNWNTLSLEEKPETLYKFVLSKIDFKNVIPKTDLDYRKYSSIADFVNMVKEFKLKNDITIELINWGEVYLSMFNEINYLVERTGINPEFHPCEYYIMENKPNMYNTVNEYLRENICLIKKNYSLDNDLYYSIHNKKIMDLITDYTLPNQTIKEYGNPLDSLTLIPIILSGSLFVRKCGEGCSIDKFSSSLFSLDYIYSSYSSKQTEASKLIDDSVYYKKYIKYKGKYLSIKKNYYK